ncbi:MAG: hypothetical protein QOF78_4452 [Phycisphaerales bacterium]|jgi:hypothetical protein|nr:hypothetical protein [Phycisphaerales bacterium]
MNARARKITWMSVALLAIAATLARAQATTPTDLVTPIDLTLQSEPPESIYAPPEAMADENAINAGGVNFTLTTTYFTDYLFRGLDRSASGSGDSGNIQMEGQMRFELGKFPDLLMGVFTNINDSDPISRFQEIRPYFALELTARPIIFTIGNTFYIYPDRDRFNTSELFARLTLDDSYFFRSDDPVLSPYVLAAWDYDKYDGFYIEAGIRHDFAMEEMPLVITPIARIAYVMDNKAFREPHGPVPDPSFDFGAAGTDTGLQHYEIGLELTYGLNELLNIPARYGKLDFKGYLFYTDQLENNLRADTQLYGGMGVGFSY